MLPNFLNGALETSTDSVVAYFPFLAEYPGCKFVFVNKLQEHGILPYHLLRVQKSLTSAFQAGDLSRVMQLSSDLGHYLGDAHVPLHTTENYNGQMSGQLGIHAFWESRIPEYFAEQEFDFLVCDAVYIEDTEAFFWHTVISSHLLVEEVLSVEMELKNNYPEHRQFCFVDRSGQTVRQECKEYAREYHNAMNQMVEAQMRLAIHAIGSCWLTAWVDAGQPELLPDVFQISPEDQELLDSLELAYRTSNALGRGHTER